MDRETIELLAAAFQEWNGWFWYTENEYNEKVWLKWARKYDQCCIAEQLEAEFRGLA